MAQSNSVARAPRLQVCGIRKAFGQNVVLKGIDMQADAGEVVALIGGNGAGKSTLMKIIMGIYTCDEGEIRIDGEPMRLGKPSASLAQGIYLVPQEPMLFPNMTVEENIVMGFEEKKGVLHTRLTQLIAQLGWKLDLSRRADTLSIAEQQLVELLRGLMRDARILILDEPTSSLTFNEVQSLFRTVEDLKAKGIAIIYITHRLTEVFEIATSVAIMRDGVITLSGAVEQFTREMLVKGLLPAEASQQSERKAAARMDYAGLKPVLSVRSLSGYGFEDVTFDVYPGEILGLAGVVGAGRTELVSTIFGKDVVRGGKVYLAGEDITGMKTDRVMKKGLSYVPEDRFLHGIFRIGDVALNSTAACVRSLGRFAMNFHKEKEITQKYIDAFRTKVTGPDQMMGSLSGGNQQKVVIGRALSITPKVLILDEPTRGIDAAARADVYAIIEQLRKTGLGILLISSDMEEIVELSDRAMTMYCGRINHCFAKEETNQDNLMAAAFGVLGEGGAAHA